MIFSGNVFPIQKLPLKDKDEEWRKANVNHIISRRNSNYIDKQNRKDIIQINYDLLDSVYNEKDLQLVANPYKVEDGFPATPQNFNVILPKVNLLIGEESKKPFNFLVVETSDNATSMLQEKKKELLLQFVEQELQSQLGVSDPSQMQGNPSLAEIEQYLTKEYKSIPEKIANTTLNYLKEKLNLPFEFLRGWKDALASGEEIYWTGVLNGDVFFERVNPLYCDFDKRPDLVFIEDGDWFLRHYRMSPASIYDRFFDMMDEEDLDRLQKMSDANYTMPMGGAQINWNPPVTFSVNNIKEVLLDVFHAVWKSYKKVGYLTFTDEQGNPQSTMVDETYKVQDGEEIEWDWIIESWEGYRVGTDLYVGIKPIEYQSVSIDNPNVKKLPYSGAIHGKALVSIMKPLQYLYIVIWYRLELALARDKGKILNMDITQIPKSMGIDVAHWMHYISALGVNLVNPYEEGWDIPGREGGKCFGRDTLILMFDGSIKTIQDIKVGDIIMGPNYTPRTVIEYHTGVDNMYKITPSSGGDVQRVNSRHDIYYGHKNHHTGEVTFETARPEELMLRFKNVPSCRDRYFLYRDKGLHFNEKDLILDPYFLGLWLGDGSTGKAQISNMDYEVISYLNDFAFSHNLNINIVPTHSKCMSINLNGGETNNRGYRNTQTNWVKNRLNELGILFDKDIPSEYIYNSRENRLKILAGLIDTDGWYDKKKNRFGFAQKRKNIADKFVFIARSLGMKVSRRMKNGYHMISILSGLQEIPTKIQRKQANREKFFSKDVNRSMFKIEYDGIDNYYGFTLKEDPLFLLGDFTISHNSAQFNQFTAMDLSMANVIDGYIKLLTKIEDMVGEISGVSRQREGAISTSELVGNVNRAVIQSSHITEPLFYLHNQAKKNALTNILNAAKYVWSVNPNKKIHYITDDVERTFLNITEDFLYSDFDVFVSDSTSDAQKLESLRTLLQPAMQAGATLSEAAEIITNNNIRSIKDKLAEIDAEKAQQAQQQQQQEQQMQQQQLQSQQENQQQELQFREKEMQIKSDTAIEVALIGAQAKAGTDDLNKNGIPDDIDLMKLDLERTRMMHTIQKEKDQNATQKKALDIQDAKNKRDAQLKEKEIEVKRIAANKKPAAAKN